MLLCLHPLLIHLSNIHLLKNIRPSEVVFDKVLGSMQDKEKDTEEKRCSSRSLSSAYSHLTCCLKTLQVYLHELKSQHSLWCVHTCINPPLCVGFITLSYSHIKVTCFRNCRGKLRLYCRWPSWPLQTNCPTARLSLAEWHSSQHRLLLHYTVPNLSQYILI